MDDNDHSDEMSAAGSEESYQKAGVTSGLDATRSEAPSGKQGSRSGTSRTSRRRGILSIFQGGLSIDHEYVQAQGTDDLEGYHDDDEDSEEWERNHNVSDGCCRPWRVIAGIVLVLFCIMSLSVAKAKRKSFVYYGDEEEERPEETCTDPMSTLRQVSVLEGLANAAVASDQPLCSKMGVSIMEELGGNAIDAAISVALCLGLSNPASSGLGGGSFMLIHGDPVDPSRPMPAFQDKRTQAPVGINGKTLEVIDCREVAPGAASTDMYAGLPNLAAVVGGLATSVPGELKCLELAHARSGSLPWADVVQPALDLAVRGVHINKVVAHEIAFAAGMIMKNNITDDFGLREVLTKVNDWSRPLSEGEILKIPKLADTLRAIMKEGADALYKGERAEQLANDIQKAGGLVTKEDLEQYQAVLRSPVVGHDINGFDICGVPPPSSGGAAVIGVARFLSGFETPMATFADTLSIHKIAEAFKHVFSIRMSLSDPTYNTEHVEAAVADLVGPYMDSLRANFEENGMQPLSSYGGEKWSQITDNDGNAVNVSDAHEGDRRRRLARPFGYLDDHGTSHFSVVDKEGNAVAMTTSINTVFGSQVLSESTGILLGNTMDDFGNPGTKNFFGMKPSEANFIKPGKKPLSSMSPTMIFRSTGDSERLGDLVLSVGASGGPKIITSVAQVIVNFLMLGKPLFDSIAHPRIHDQLLYHDAAVTNTESMELIQGPTIELSQRTKDALERRGYQLLDMDYAGTVQAIAIDMETKTLTAASDIRKGGAPAGY